MNNSTNTLSPIKLSLQVELPKLPDKFGVFDSFGGQNVNNKLRFNFLKRHIDRFNYGLRQLAQITNNPNIPQITLDYLIGNIETLFNKSAHGAEFLSKHEQFRFRLWTDLSQTSLEVAPFTSRFNNSELAELLSCKFTRNLTFKYTPAKESISSIQQALSKNLHEGLLIDESNQVTESSWSNFFWIDQDDVICASGVGLDGITQQVLRDIYSRQNIFATKPINLSELLSSKFACFLTNSLEGVVQIKAIDGINMKLSSQIDNIKRCYNDYCINNEVTWIQIDS
jgi:hypothetical protein